MKNIVITLLVLFSLALVACTPEVAVENQPQPDVIIEKSMDTSYKSATIVIERMQFNPQEIVLEVGDTLEWVNVDEGREEEYGTSGFEGPGLADHTVTFDNGMLDEHLPRGGSVTLTFTQAGRYTYFDQYHPEMSGVVIVR